MSLATPDVIQRSEPCGKVSWLIGWDATYQSHCDPSLQPRLDHLCMLTIVEGACNIRFGGHHEATQREKYRSYQETTLALTKHGFKYTLFNTRLGPLDLLHGELPGLHAAPGSIAFSDEAFTSSSLAKGNRFGNTWNVPHILIHSMGQVMLHWCKIRRKKP